MAAGDSIREHILSHILHSNNFSYSKNYEIKENQTLDSNCLTKQGFHKCEHVTLYS